MISSVKLLTSHWQTGLPQPVHPNKQSYSQGQAEIRLLYHWKCLTKSDIDIRTNCLTYRWCIPFPTECMRSSTQHRLHRPKCNQVKHSHIGWHIRYLNPVLWNIKFQVIRHEIDNYCMTICFYNLRTLIGRFRIEESGHRIGCSLAKAHSEENYQ